MSTSLRVVLILLALSLVALTLSGLGVYARLSYLWIFLIVAAWIWSRLSLSRVEVERSTRIQRAHVGTIFEERFTVKNGGRLPRLWVQIRDGSDLPGSRGSRVLTLIGPREQRSYRARTRLVQRGVFTLGPTEVRSGDLFGLFPVSRKTRSQGSLLVYPMMVPVEAFPSPPGLLPGGEALQLRTHQVTPNASGVREYVPGDPLSRIHWLSSARRDRLIVKEFELDPMAEVWLFLDAQRTVHTAEEYSPPTQAVEAIWSPWRDVMLPPATEEYAVSIVATLARHFLRRDRAVGLISYRHSKRRTPEVLPPDRGGRQLGKILEVLAPLRALGNLPISALMTAHAQHMPRGSTVIVVTPSVDNEVALAADLLSQRGLRPVVVLIDAASFGGATGTEALARAVAAADVPVCQVRNGDDLTVALSVDLGGTMPSRTRLSRTPVARRLARA